MAEKTQTEKDTAKAASKTTRSGEYQRRIDRAAEAEQVGTPQGNVDFVASSTTASSGGSSGDPGIYVPDQDFILLNADILDGYDSDSDSNWSVEFTVTNGVLDLSSAAGTTNTEQWDGSGATPQSFFRINVIRTLASEKYTFSPSGQYQRTYELESSGLKAKLKKIA